MLVWEEVVQNKVLLSRVEELIGEVTYTFHDFPQEICDELNQLTGNNWTGDNYIEYCAEYWESWWNLDEVVFALFHDGDYPNKREEELYAWKIEQCIDEDKNVISFFRFGKYKKYENESYKINKYENIDVKQLYTELLEAFPNWNNDVASWEEDDYRTFRCTNKETYAYEKEIYISNRHKQKFIDCTLTNMNEVEKDILQNIIHKYCNHVTMDA